MFNIKILGDHPVTALLRDEFCCGDSPRVILEVQDRPIVPPLDANRAAPLAGFIKDMWCDKRGIFWMISYYRRRFPEFYRMYIRWPEQPGDPIYVTISSSIQNPRTAVRDLLQRGLSSEYRNNIEDLAYSISNMVEFVIFFFNPCKALLLHSSCVAWQHNALLVTGRSNVGKTTLNTAFMAEYGASYFSEDMTFMEEGSIYSNPRRYRIYPDTLVRNAPLKAALGDGGFFNKLHFRINSMMGGRRVTRRLIPPQVVWGDARIGTVARPVYLVLLRREAGLNGILDVAHLDHETMVQVCLENTVEDYRYLIENMEIGLSCLERNLTLQYAFDWQDRYRELLRESLTDTMGMELVAGFDGVSPCHLAERIVEELRVNMG